MTTPGPASHPDRPEPAQADTGARDLHARIADAIRRRADEQGTAVFWGDLADAVMPVVDGALAEAEQQRGAVENTARSCLEQRDAAREALAAAGVVIASLRDQRDVAAAAADPFKIERVTSLVAASTRLIRTERDAERQNAEQAEDRARANLDAIAEVVLLADEQQQRAEQAEDLYRSAAREVRDLVTKLGEAEDDARYARSELAKADAENNATGARAKQADAAVQRVRAFFEDMRTWCSPYGVAADYAKRGLAALDQPEGT